MTPLLEIRDLKVHFTTRHGFMDEIIRNRKSIVRAVDGINLSVGRGEIISLVGESGSGKTTLGKAVLSLVKKTGGEICFEGKEIPFRSGRYLQAFRRKVQMIFQDPYQSLNPRHRVLDIVEEPLRVNRMGGSPAERKEEVVRALERAGMRPAENYLHRYPHELSGGQRQRVAIAAVLVMEPTFIVADEPVSMLDVSIRADILRLMARMRDAMGISCLLITHDLSLAWMISDRIAIMYLGKIVEAGSPDLIVGACRHPYTKALVGVMPTAGAGRNTARSLLRGETPTPLNIPNGCRFHPRCPVAMDICFRQEPTPCAMGPGHLIACHRETGTER